MIDNRKLPELQKYLNPSIFRYDIINHFIRKHNFQNYLEIGVFMGENIRKVNIAHKDGVDPGHENFIVPEVNYSITSDEFFDFIKGHNEIKYDIIFIDGLHYADQVEKDILNSLNHIVDNGIIVLHDCNPLNFLMQTIPRECIVWTGDVWKTIVKLRSTRDYLTIRVVDTDFGVGIVEKKSNTYTSTLKDTKIEWDFFDKNRENMLGLISTDEFFKLY